MTSPSTLAPRRGGFLAMVAGLALATTLATGLYDTGHSSSAAQEGSSHNDAARIPRPATS